MKWILLFIVILSSSFIHAQNSYKCGKWIIDTIIKTEWKTTDSLNATTNYNANENDSDWAYSKWHEIYKARMYVKCICGCGYERSFYQRRINKKWIHQIRQKTIYLRYVPYELTLFEERINQLN